MLVTTLESLDTLPDFCALQSLLLTQESLRRPTISSWQVALLASQGTSWPSFSNLVHETITGTVIGIAGITVVETTMVLVPRLLVFWVQHLLPLVNSDMAQVILL